ncbi:hypothetical protein PMAYCL1PPCAC_20559, partial [Pristionchus mayeri]
EPSSPRTGREFENPSNIDLNRLSDLEKLPMELMRKIFDYIIEALFDLKLTSRMLRYHVDEYAKQRVSIPLVDVLSFYGTEESGECGTPSRMVSVSMFVPVKKASLFELRLKLLEPPPGFLQKMTRNVKCGDKRDSNGYHITLDTELRSDVDFDKWEHLLKCTGKRIEKASLFECSAGVEFASSCRLLQNFKFDKLEVTSNDLSMSVISQILRVIKAHSVTELSLTVRYVTTDQPVQFLTDLSSLISYLRIHQLPVHTSGSSCQYFFGSPSFDWGPVII